MRGQPLTLLEREKIELYQRGKWKLRRIATALRRHHSVLSRELKRNSGRDGIYRSAQAHLRALMRESQPHHRILDQNLDLRQYVIANLKEGLSPEQIAGRLKNRPPPALQGKGISHEAIYQWIYDGEGRYLGLYQYLPKKKRKRTKRMYRKSRTKETIPHMTPIRYRGKSEEPGDWESDTVIFPLSRSTLSVQYEPKLMYTRLRKTTDKTADETEVALRLTVESMPQEIMRSITFDRGSEGAHHWKLRHDYSLDTYHCDTYCSWQKGAIENDNGLVRRYLPRSINLDLISSYEIHLIQEKLNDRPRKKLNYRTPNEALNEYLASRGVVH